jgi:phospholipase A1/A2
MPYLSERTLKAILSGIILLGISFFNLAQDNDIQDTIPTTPEIDSPQETDSPSLTIEQRIAQAKLQITELKAELKANKKNKQAVSILDKRSLADQQINLNPFSLAQHNTNYLFPISYVSNPNPTSQQDLTSENIDKVEAVFQISTKIPIYLEIDEEQEALSGVYFGFTARSFWQVYNDEVSKPFRETNYEPEVFYQWQADLSLLKYRFNALQIGVNHQSNGQSGLRSRSWNRVIFTALFSDADSAYYVRSWWRFPEDTKTSIDDPTGDDNPDINDYIGRVELGYAFQVNNIEIFTRIRNNLSGSQNRGSVQVNLTYPLSQRYDLLLQYFNGYGDSLIDYNSHQSRFSLGVQLRFL